MARVLLVGKGPPDQGGIAAHLQDLLDSTLAVEHDIAFLNVAHHGPPEGGKVSVGNLRRTIRDTAAVWRASKGRDVVHIHSALAPAVTMLRAGMMGVAARARGATVMAHAHGGRVQLWLISRRRRALAKVAMLAVRRIAAVSVGGADALGEALGHKRVVTLDNGVDLEQFTPAAHTDRRHGPPTVLYVGLVTPRKGLGELFAASRQLTERGVDHNLVLVGGTPDEGEEAETEVRTTAPTTAQMLGPRPRAELPAHYRSADVFCLPSWWEAMPLSILEAMASGLPVVATSVGDVSRLVDDGVTGFVVPPRNAVALAAALAKILADPDLRDRLGTAGRARAEARFSLTATIGRLSAMYTELANRR